MCSHNQSTESLVLNKHLNSGHYIKIMKFIVAFLSLAFIVSAINEVNQEKKITKLQGQVAMLSIPSDDNDRLYQLETMSSTNTFFLIKTEARLTELEGRVQSDENTQIGMIQSDIQFKQAVQDYMANHP